jgi:hypothetical protein
MLAGIDPNFKQLVHSIRLRWPRFMFVKTMMVGCVASEGHLDDGDESTRAATARSLASAIVSNGIVLTISGWLGDVLGRKRYFLICIRPGWKSRRQRTDSEALVPSIQPRSASLSRQEKVEGGRASPLSASDGADERLRANLKLFIRR